MPTQARASLGIAASRRREILGRRQQDLLSRGHVDAAHFLARASVRADNAGQDNCVPYVGLEQTLQHGDLLAKMLEDAREVPWNARSSSDEAGASIISNTVTGDNHCEDDDSNSLLAPSESSCESEDACSGAEDCLSTRDASPIVTAQTSRKVSKANRVHGPDKSDGALHSLDNPTNRSQLYGLFMEDEDWDVAYIDVSPKRNNSKAASPSENHTKDTTRTESFSNSSLNFGISPIKARHETSLSSGSVTTSVNDLETVGEDPYLYSSFVGCCLNPPFDKDKDATTTASTVHNDSAGPATTSTTSTSIPKQTTPRLPVSNVNVAEPARTITGSHAVVVQDDPPPRFDTAPPQPEMKSKRNRCLVLMLLALSFVSFSVAGVLIYHHFYGPLWGQFDNDSDVQVGDNFSGPATSSLSDAGEDDFSFYIGANRQDQADSAQLLAWQESPPSDGAFSIELGLGDCMANALVPASRIPIMVVPTKAEDAFCTPLWLRSEKFWPESTFKSLSYDPLYRNFDFAYKDVLFIGLDMMSDDDGSDDMRDRLWHNYDWILRVMDNSDAANVRAIFIFGFHFDRLFLDVLEFQLGALSVPVVYVFVGTQDEMKLKDRSKDGTWKAGSLWSLRLGKRNSGHLQVVVRKANNDATPEDAAPIGPIGTDGLIEFRAP